MILKSAWLATSLVVFTQGAAIAGSCNAYPETIGVKTIDTPSGVKILSTAQVSVPIDDVDVYSMALEEGQVEARAAISAFMEVSLNKECDNMKLTTSEIQITSEGKSVDVAKVKATLCSARSQTDALLRGSVVIGDCYTPGKFLRVTVGIKPATVSQASRLTNQMNQTGSGVNINSDYSPSESSGSLKPVGGYSNSNRLDSF